MAASEELAQFLASRRAKVTPEQAGLPTYGRRQVPGLRREEVASLAGVSVDYYKRLERGNATGASESVLDALADALQLDDAERAHLFDLARTASTVTPPRRRRAAKSVVRPAVLQLLNSIDQPATLSTQRMDYLAANPLGRALYAPLFDSREQPPNSARFTFLDPVAQEFFLDWEKAAKELVGNLRGLAGANPYDRALSDLIGELSTRSAPFRTWWAAHNVRHHQTGSKRIDHPVVGPLDLSYEVLELPADNGLRLAVFQADPGSTTQQALDLLASWAATPVPDEAPRGG